MKQIRDHILSRQDPPPVAIRPLDVTDYEDVYQGGQ